MAFNYGWPDQELINLMVAHRRQHNEDLKRLDYYQRTILRSKISTLQVQAAHQVQAEQVQDDSIGANPTDDKTLVLAEISQQLGVGITGWFKLMTEPPQYIVGIEGVKVTVGDGGAVLRQVAFNRAVYEACDRAIITVPKAAWLKIINRLGAIKEAIYPDSLETEIGYCRFWLQKYLAESMIVESAEEIESTDLPCRLQGTLYFSLNGFKRFLLIHNQKENKGFSNSLREIGCEIATKGYQKTGGGWTTKSLWRVPPEMLA
jgi:hypothetical protein